MDVFIKVNITCSICGADIWFPESMFHIKNIKDDEIDETIKDINEKLIEHWIKTNLISDVIRSEEHVIEEFIHSQNNEIVFEWAIDTFIPVIHSETFTELVTTTTFMHGCQFDDKINIDSVETALNMIISSLNNCKY